MIKFQDIKVGDYLMADNDGDILQGEVTDLNHDEKQVCVDTGTQEFWFETTQLSAIPLDEEQLFKLKFTKHENEDGTVKYLKGAFRILLPAKEHFSSMEIWYRDERRHILQPISVHQLQNHFYEMTKVHLNHESFA
jgi:ribosomal protein S1